MTDIYDIIYEMGLDHNLRRDRPYTGQSHTDLGIRGAQEVYGVTMRDIRDCYLRAICLSAGVENPLLYEEAEKGENGCICENDIFDLHGSIDPISVQQNLTCEIEKLMGIFPNIVREEKSND